MEKHQPARKLTPEKRETFLTELRKMPNVSNAAREIGMSRMQMYTVRDADPEFAKLWDEALKEGVENWEAETARRAFNGVNEPLTHAGHITYEIDTTQPRDLVTGLFPWKLDANGNRIPVTVKKYSDVLSIFMLKAHAPEKYRENLDVTVRDGDLAQRLIEARNRAG